MLSERARERFEDMRAAIELVSRWVEEAGGPEKALAPGTLQ